MDFPCNSLCGFSLQAGSTVCGEPSSLSVRHRKLWRQRHHGGTTEQGTGCSVVGQTQVSKTHWDFFFFSATWSCTYLFVFFIWKVSFCDTVYPKTHYVAFLGLCFFQLVVHFSFFHLKLAKITFVWSFIIKKLFLSQSISSLCRVMKEQMHLFRLRDRDTHFYTSSTT